MLSRTALLGLICLLAVGCASTKRALPEPEPAKISYLYHTVKTPGETLGHIAQWYSGDWKNWEFIASHNPALNPKRIKVGDRVAIPEQIVVKRTPLPKEQVVASNMRRVVDQMNVSGEKIKGFFNGMMSQFRATK